MRTLLAVIAGLVEMVGVTVCVFVVAAVAVAQEVCVELFELLVEEVYVAEEVDVFVEDADRVVAPDPVCVGEEDAEPVADTVGGGTRVRVPVIVSVTEGRGLTLPQEVEVAVRVPRAVTVPEGVPVSLNDPL